MAADATTEQPRADGGESVGEVRGELATTGASTFGVITVAALLLLVGMLLVVAHRRRQSTMID